ncbi:acyl-CoA/acyl-ACP dehydrogenase [Sphingobium sp. BYY-5]|uniref:acyl-CoA dehydrogenase family protein n=1 Tax=Sphingobium sp. BYY-5 TaxID=2926400 RepID=UPI001FA78435|nr:acyl-CoA dehydrogenase family protein [Sphingobium sp. BYY-5]MCI4592011.1 acyl-CoA/acyl-ACP dehydrogenase [Sphingobium sp. BYY-5]
MSMTRAELQDAADRAFAPDELAPDATQSWNRIAEMGWLMMAVPEEQGGLGLGLEAVGVVHQALGRALVPGPAIAQMLVIEALSASGREDLLASAMAGEVMTASLAEGSTAIPDADRASHVLLVDDTRIRLLPIESCAITTRPTWDQTRRLFDVIAGEDGAILLAEGRSAAILADRIIALRSLAMAADCLGGAGAVLALTIDYLQTRQQFDRPLALFQALKHRVADMKTVLAAADALFWARANDPTADRTAAGALKVHAAGVYRLIAEEAIQLHGGIGLTIEHPCHLFLKRSMLNAALGGDADHWNEQRGRQAMVAMAPLS